MLEMRLETATKTTVTCFSDACVCAMEGLLYTVNPQFKPQGLIDFMVLNHPGSN